MERQEFIDGYCKRSGVTWGDLSRRFVALPCHCGEASCEGWAMVTNDPENIALHNQVYGPRFSPA